MYICQHCEKEFTPKYKFQKKNPPLYCSTECYHESTKSGTTKTCIACGKRFYIWKGRKHQFHCSRKCRWKTDGAEMVTKVCPVCKNTFTINKSMAHRYNVCSMECKLNNAIRKFCQRCGKVFTAKREDINHCSEECRRPPIHINCLYCDKVFRIVPSMKNIKRFCSFSCYRKYCGESSIEKVTRKSLDRLGIIYSQEYQIKTYSVDFYLHDNNACLEVDGEYWHADSEKDRKRDRFLKKLGYKIIRIKELEIMNSDNVDKLILNKLNIYSSIQGEIVHRQRECKGGASTIS